MSLTRMPALSPSNLWTGEHFDKCSPKWWNMKLKDPIRWLWIKSRIWMRLNRFNEGPFSVRLFWHVKQTPRIICCSSLIRPCDLAQQETWCHSVGFRLSAQLQVSCVRKLSVPSESSSTGASETQTQTLLGFYCLKPVASKGEEPVRSPSGLWPTREWGRHLICSRKRH